MNAGPWEHCAGRSIMGGRSLDRYREPPYYAGSGSPMSLKSDLALRQDDHIPGPDLESERDLQEFWLLLAKKNWRSLAILPAHPEGSTEVLARSLARVGKNLSFLPVSSVTVKVLGSSSALALAALAHHVRNRQERLWHGDGVIEAEEEASEAPKTDDGGYLLTPAGQLVIGVPSVVTEPVGMAVLQAVDTVVLAVEVGRTTMADVRRSIRLIGRERIAGCYLM